MIGIFGTGRNGSTLLMRLLDGSSDMWVYPIELNYLGVFDLRSSRGGIRSVTRKLISRLHWDKIGRKERYVLGFSQWAASQLDELNRTYVEKLTDPIQTKGNPLEIITQGIGQSLQSDLVTFLNSVRLVYDDRSSVTNPLFVFKSIEVADLNRYCALFPEMRFIHVVRHPFGSYSSLKRTNMIIKEWPFWRHGGDQFRMFFETRWIPHARFIVKACVPGSDKHLLVRYEDLCDRPEETIHSICRWLEVAPPVDPTLQTVLGGRRMKELPSNPSQKGVETPDRVVTNMVKKFGYEDVLTEREKEFIVSRTYHLAHQLGYFTKEEQVELPNRLNLAQKWFSPDRWELMNAHSRLRLARALITRRCYIYSKLLLSSFFSKDGIAYE